MVINFNQLLTIAAFFFLGWNTTIAQTSPPPTKAPATAATDNTNPTTDATPAASPAPVVPPSEATASNTAAPNTAQKDTATAPQSTIADNTATAEEPTAAPEKQTARQVIESFQAALIETMKQGKKLGYQGRYQKLKEPVLRSHDLSKIARIVLGKEWKKLTAEQKKDMVELFTQLSIASYAHNFKDFSGEAFKYDSENQTSRGGIIVHTFLVLPKDKDVKFDYMMKNKGDSWLIINIIANGVSDLALKRSEYTSILKREGFDALLKKISSKIEKYSTSL